MFSYIRVKNKTEPDMSKISMEHKILVLAEQLVAVNYLLHASENDSLINGHRRSIISAIHKEVKAAQHLNLPPLTKSYLRLLNTHTEESLPNLTALYQLFSDFTTFPKSMRSLDMGFLEPLFFAMGKKRPDGVTDTYHNAIIYTPYTCSQKNGNTILLVPEVFTSFNMGRFDTSHVDSGNPFFNYLARFSWNGKHINQFTSIIMSFKCHNFGKFRNTTPVVIYNALRDDLPTSMDKNQSKALRTYLSMTKLLSEHYAIDTSNKTVGRILQAFPKYRKVLSYFHSNQTTLGQEELFHSFPELAFLAKTGYKVALEAAEDETPDESEDDDEKPEEGTPKDDNDIEDPDDPDTGSDDSEDDDLDGFGDDTSSEPSTDDGSSSSGDSAKVTVKDTPPEDEDPSPDSLELTVVDQETYDEYIERQALISDIRSVIANPPAGMHTTEVELLKLWLSGWIHLVSVDSTKDLLSLLSVQI